MYARRNYQLFTISIEDIDAALKEKDTVDLDRYLLNEFKDFKDVFSLKNAEKLPPHRLYDHDIKL